jgi:hypothetical protein
MENYDENSDGASAEIPPGIENTEGTRQSAVVESLNADGSEIAGKPGGSGVSYAPRSRFAELKRKLTRFPFALDPDETAEVETKEAADARIPHSVFALDPEEIAEAEASYGNGTDKKNVAAPSDYSGYWAKGVTQSVSSTVNIAAKTGARKGFLKEILIETALAAAVAFSAVLWSSASAERRFVYGILTVCCALGFVAVGVYFFRALKARKLIESGEVLTVTELAKRLSFKRREDALTLAAGLIKSGKLIGYGIAAGETIKKEKQNE